MSSAANSLLVCFSLGTERQARCRRDACTQGPRALRTPNFLFLALHALALSICASCSQTPVLCLEPLLQLSQTCAKDVGIALKLLQSGAALQTRSGP